MTGLNSNIDQVIQRFQLAKRELDSIDFSEALIVGVNAAKGLLSFRIFNKGMDAEGISLGKYVGKKKGGTKKEFASDAIKKRIIGSAGEFTPYELKRIKAGRQVVYKDFEFTGDLRRGVQTIKESNIRVVCAIPNDDLAKIANALEEQIAAIRAGTSPKAGGPKAKVFSLSESERQALKDNTSASLKQIYDRILNAK